MRTARVVLGFDANEAFTEHTQGAAAQHGLKKPTHRTLTYPATAPTSRRTGRGGWTKHATDQRSATGDRDPQTVPSCSAWLQIEADLQEAVVEIVQPRWSPLWWSTLPLWGGVVVDGVALPRLCRLPPRCAVV